MRNLIDIVLILVAGALCLCVLFARRSGKRIGKTVAAMTASLIPPILGNVLIITTQKHLTADIGSLLYFVGMDVVMYWLLRFTFRYCEIPKPSRGIRILAYGLLIADVVQLLLNPVFGHAFGHEPILFDGMIYFRLIPRTGQMFHRALDYGILAYAMVLFARKAMHSARIDAQRYIVILAVMILTALWESFYIFTGTPIDRSMIGFGLFGVVIFYYALYYQPVRLMNRILSGIAEETTSALFFFDELGKCIWANQRGMNLTETEAQDYGNAGEKLKGLFSDIDEDGIWQRIESRGIGDDRRYFMLEKRPVPDRHNQPVGSFLSVRDNTTEHTERVRERYLATHDPLTGLYNRDTLYQRIAERLKTRRDVRWMIIYVNVNDFKIIHDIFGADFSNRVLQEVGAWVAEGMSANTIYGRLVGDTFGACIPADEFNAGRIEQKLNGFIVRQGGMEHAAVIHLGVYEVTDPTVEVSVMFDRAKVAESSIHKNFRQHIAYYNNEIRDHLLLAQQLSGQLGEAIEKRHVQPYLQPMTDRDGRIVGAEVLARWDHPEKGFLQPAVFIGEFEGNGMIAQLDRAMWRFACEILHDWKTTYPELFLSVNISPRDFYFMDVADELRNLLKEFGLEPYNLRLEITETVMLNDREKHLSVIEALRGEGFLIEMDDFGSGYSSLNMLKEIPLDVLKIDMAFLRREGEQNKARRILNGILSMTEDFGMESVIEGVQTEEQYRMMAGMGCRLFQGFYFAKPMQRDEFEALLEAGGSLLRVG